MPLAGKTPKRLMEVLFGSSRLRVFSVEPIHDQDVHARLLPAAGAKSRDGPSGLTQSVLRVP
jgi:hypothetical protein